MFENEIVDTVAEMIGQKYTKSQIKRELRETCPTLGVKTMETLISLARAKIRQMYKIDPIEFKGSAIEFYCSIIRNKKADLRYRILCHERLDKLLGLEQVSAADPEVYAERIRAAMEEAEASVTGKQVEEKAVVENHSDIFGSFSVDDLDPALKDLAVKLNESDE